MKKIKHYDVKDKEQFIIPYISVYLEQIAKTINEKGKDCGLLLYFQMFYYSDYFDYVKT